MSHMRKDYGGVFGLAGVLLVLLVALLCSLGGCASPAHDPSQSWDQANLKRYDHGCPTSVFIAPDGNLVQCQVEFVSKFFGTAVLAPPEFDTVEEAAIAGFKAIAAKPTAPFYEWGGIIVQAKNGKFSALPANTSFSGDSVGIHVSGFGLNSTPVAGYHTHPCIPEHDVEYFSAEDLLGPLFYHMAAFMGDFCTGNVHEFKVGDKQDVEHPENDAGQTAFLTKGRIVGQFTAPHTMTVAE